MLSFVRPAALTLAAIPVPPVVVVHRRVGRVGAAVARFVCIASSSLQDAFWFGFTQSSQNWFRFQDSHLVSHQFIRLDPSVAPGVAPGLCGEGHEVVIVIVVVVVVVVVAPVSPGGALRLLARLFLEKLASVAPFGAEGIYA